ncbi:purine catabolism regulatory protein [Andreesenia angusta]|uniref:Purine catabolism regulatory protein n=1 Tax=Andreesenia angusta TaxID=39480 RepID=A0A1S1V7X4_9FIRM|nr:PucR family transcriptional regulator [Andreesenia angusta]OHW62716.1 purine catabolism regulatory protein [Andreesenia angusta]
MGITVREMLELEYFKDFKVIAGHRGIDRQIQGVAVLDAPDGFKWTKGKELVISSGYIFSQQPETLEKYALEGPIDRIAGLGIKVDRYMKEIPKVVIEAFEKKGTPLIWIPNEPAWMDVVNQLNVLVMNNSIKRFKIGAINPMNYSNLTYESRKIDKILSHIEDEMGFPAMVYDLTSDKHYYSSSRFNEISEGIETSEFWSPGLEHTVEVLCDNLNIVRYKVKSESYSQPYSWITVPITVGDEKKAYFVIVEADDTMDYFDQFVLRIGFLLLQSLYEQMLVAQSIKDLGVEKFVSDIISKNLEGEEQISKRAAEVGLDTSKESIIVAVRQRGGDVNLSSYRDEIQSVAVNTIRKIGGRAVITLDGVCVLIFPLDEKSTAEKGLEQIFNGLEEFESRFKKKEASADFVFGVSDIPDRITNIRRNYERAVQSVKMGCIIYPDRKRISYSELGLFAWMDVKEDELDIMLKSIDRLIESDTDGELLDTLRVYLECQMNYSLTSKKIFVHINTVRKRVARISELISFDLDEPTNRLKLEMVLKFLQR